MAKKAISRAILMARAERIRKCIASSGVKQNAIARFCDVTTQSVGGWKRSGQIEPDNLYKLAEITKHRYLWLRDGTGNELITDPSENAKALSQDFQDVGHLSIGPLSGFPEGDELIASINRFISQSGLKLSSLPYLTAFFNQVSGYPSNTGHILKEANAETPDIETNLLQISAWLKEIPDETRLAVGELLKALSTSPDLSEQIIRSIMALSITSGAEKNPIRSARLRKGWSSAYFADEIGVSRQTVSSWESKESDVWPERDRWAKISDVLGVPIQDLASFSIHKIPKSRPDSDL